MELLKKVENNTVIVEVSGEVDGSNVKEFETALRNDSEGAECFIIDLKDLHYVSSAGLRTFLLMQKKMGKNMKIRNVGREVMDIFSITGFVKLLNIE